MLNTDTTSPNSPVINHLHHIHDLPVECDTLDLSPAVQTQCSTIDGFTREEVVRMYIWNNKNASKHCKACIQQNGDQFGYIPLNDLKISQGPEVIWKQTSPQCPLSFSTTNHASALKYETYVEEYITEELKHGALYGPFEDLDLDIHVPL